MKTYAEFLSENETSTPGHLSRFQHHMDEAMKHLKAHSEDKNEDRSEREISKKLHYHLADVMDNYGG